ncbi:short chain dehydrogenase reductase [Niveomyces insectorum RCEF 264]|uniref:Short chain dehydrogenase reductase n=1 Tax=Niveomyces insectorum RCEF 264 TaxID=1081102 RepID=A0A167TFV4_9HYPO|nr:short chain dehydrogenase reductase [Niveomyces insectorum RCEF 264]
MSKVVIVTGASRGIGLAVARHLLAHAHKVVLVARTAAPLAALKNEFPSQVEYMTVDATDFAANAKIVELALQTFGRLDGVVINHAALTPLARLADADIDEWKRLYDVNVFSTVALVKAVIPPLRAAHGRIVFTSSGAALRAYASWAAYGSSKLAGNSVVQHLAVEEPDIVSVAVGPGRVDTDMQKELREQGQAVMADKDYAGFVEAFQDGKLNPPEKPAEVIAKLALDAAADLSGQCVK